MTTKAYNVVCTALVNKGCSLARDSFRARIAVKSPKTGRVLTDVCVEYLDAGNIYQLKVVDAVDGRPTLEKILKGFENATRKVGATKYHDELTATIQLTAHDLHCIQLAHYIQLAWRGWQARQEYYAD